MSTKNIATYSDLHIRMDANIKKEAESILEDLGIAPSGAINMFYRQVIAHDGLPFKVVRRSSPVPEMSEMSQEEINAQLEKANVEIDAGKFRPAGEAFAEILGEKYAKI